MKLLLAPFRNDSGASNTSIMFAILPIIFMSHNAYDFNICRLLCLAEFQIMPLKMRPKVTAGEQTSLK